MHQERLWVMYSGLPHSNQDHIPYVFPVFSTLFFGIKIKFIPLPPHHLSPTITNSLKPSAIASFHYCNVPPNQMDYKIQKITSQHNCGTYFYFQNFKIVHVLDTNRSNPCKNLVLIFLGKFPVFSLTGKTNILILCSVATLAF